MIRLGGMAGLVLSGCLAAGALAEEPGRSVFAEVFEDGVPHPFSALLDRLREVAGEENVQTALIPVGRSLQRYSAAPDLFASPRLVVAVTADRAAGPGAPRLADRLFLGFQPAGDAVEALSYDEAAGRFEFEEIVGYDAEDRAIEPARREICTRCHQGEAPIFPKPLWDESNASARIATRLAGLGPVWNGAPVAQSVDALEAFDAAVRRAGRVELANLLWSEGCPDAGCRADLLLAALGRLLAGPAAGLGDGADFSALAATRWPDGIALIPGAIPNRDPLVAPGDPLETSGVLDPETPRAPETVWARAPMVSPPPRRRSRRGSPKGTPAGSRICWRGIPRRRWRCVSNATPRRSVARRGSPAFRDPTVSRGFSTPRARGGWSLSRSTVCRRCGAFRRARMRRARFARRGRRGSPTGEGWWSCG